MHPILASRQHLAAYLAGWLLVAALLAGFLARGEFTPSQAVLMAVPMSLLYAFVCLAAWYVCRARPLPGTAPVRLAVSVVASSMVAGGVWIAAGHVWALALDPYVAVSGVYAGLVDSLFVTGVFLFLMSIAVHHLVLMIEQSRDAERHALESQVLARESELRALRAQIDPHFLFNSLNSISALTVPEPAAARKMCLLLADFFRGSLTLGARDCIALSEELELAEKFLAIEKVRFGVRLDVERRVDPECAGYAVPPFLIQPLVENAVRHGVGHLVEGGAIRISVERHESSIQITIENPFDPEEVRNGGAGVGLKNVRARLNKMFSGKAVVEVDPADRIFRVSLRFPCVRMEAEDEQIAYRARG